MKNILFPFLFIFLCFYSNNTAQNESESGNSFSIKDTLITHLISQVNSDSIRSYTLKLESFGTRYAYAPDKDKVTNWIIDKFKSFGYSNIEVDSFLTNNIWCKNITAELKGKLFPDNSCITGAHYDSYAYELSYTNAPGADDNASGTAAVLEMARIAKLNNFTPNFTIKFITFDAEEVGLLGSANIATKYKEAGQKIKLMINQDMIATTASIDTIVNIICKDNFELYGRYAAAQTAGFSKLRAKVTLSGGRSDYLSFSQNGYPSISYNEPELSDKMHSKNDLSLYCNYEYCAEVVRASFATLLHSSLSPSVVSDLVAANIGDGKSVRLKWSFQKDSGIQHFKVYMGKSPWNFDSSLISLDTSVVFDNLNDGTAYYFGVSAIDNDNMEGIIKQISITADHLPFAPKNLADSPEKDRIVLKWIKNIEEDLSGYNIYRSMDSTHGFIKLNPSLLRDAIYIDKAIKDTTLFYYVTSLDTNGSESPRSNLIRSNTVGLDHGILIVDDNSEFYGDKFNDAQIDSFFVSLVSVYPIGNLDLQKGHSMKFSDLGRYAVVIWHNSSFFFTEKNIDALKSYLDYGGKLLYTGFSISDFDNRSANTRTFEYKAGDFMYDYFKIKYIEKSTQSSFAGAFSAKDQYPSIIVAKEEPFWGSMKNIEVIQPSTEGKIIYKFDPWEASDIMKGLPVGIEYLGNKYKTVILNFPLFYMDHNQAKSVIDYILKTKFNYSTFITDNIPQLKNGYHLSQNYPNPFNPSTRIFFNVPKYSYIVLKVYDLLGREISALVKGYKPEGNYYVDFDAGGLASGIYIYNLKINEHSVTKKMLLIR